MSLTNKIILCGLSAGFLWASAAQAEVKNGADSEVTLNSEAKQAGETTDSATAEETSKPEAILFRVENITPIANKEGVTDECGYILTVYNRSDRPLKEAKLVLTWVDNLSGKYKLEESQLKVVSGEKAVSYINSEITLDGIAPHKQKSFEQKVKTDKCYLLLDNTKFNVTSCNVEGLSKAEGETCQSLFNYIDSKNPEYYSEFKDVPASVLEKQAEDEKKQELSKIDETIGKITQNMDETTELLRKLK